VVIKTIGEIIAGVTQAAGAGLSISTEVEKAAKKLPGSPVVINSWIDEE
jgi:hypothetical protein